MNNSDTLTWHGNIVYGKYSGNTWIAVDGFEDPIFQENLQSVKSKPELFEGFNLYVIGGLLEDWKSWDVDWVLTGPYDPTRIKAALDWITKCGFDHHIWPDASYLTEIFDIRAWQDGEIESKEDWLYHLFNFFTKDGLQQDLSYFESIDGFYRNLNPFPTQKNLEKHEQGYKYHHPVQIFKNI